jgi:hypothetical protein
MKLFIDISSKYFWQNSVSVRTWLLIYAFLSFFAFNEVEETSHQLFRGMTPCMFIVFINNWILMYCALGRVCMVMTVVDSNCLALYRSLLSLYLPRIFGLLL